jgi:type II secretory ATPase GspE/PulE/Tfp pilus assembly ATPase PilB-like protein
MRQSYGWKTKTTPASPAAPTEAAASVIEIVDRLIALGARRRASDIHIEPAATAVRVRLRVDGLLEAGPELPRASLPEIVARIKVMARLRTDEHQAPQDGRFRAVLRSIGAMDVRVSTVPASHGESVVMRLLPERGADLRLDALGMAEDACRGVERALAANGGLIIATGPTGSGKTSTLYSMIAAKNRPDIAIATIEDPVEYAMEGVVQITANARAGLGFAAGLRALLRQDPDVIMVGEIRDEETAALAVNAALTGHLVLTTLHTNDAASAIVRLMDLGVAPFLLASTVSLVIGQRLLRAVCRKCATTERLSDGERQRLHDLIPPGQRAALAEHAGFTKGVGCADCGKSGYAGRLGAYEVLAIDAGLRTAMLERVPSARLKALAVASGMRTMAEDAWSKAMAGKTTPEEILRVLYE